LERSILALRSARAFFENLGFLATQENSQTAVLEFFSWPLLMLWVLLNGPGYFFAVLAREFSVFLIRKVRSVNVLSVLLRVFFFALVFAPGS
jgi:hypothetical protein